MTDHTQPPGDPFEPIDPFDESQPVDPFAGLSGLEGGEPLPPLEDPSLPPAAPPRSPILTGMIVALLLVVLTVALFAFLSDDDGDTTAAATTTPGETAAPTTAPSTSTPDGSAAPTTAPVTTQVGGPVADFEPYVAAGEPVSIDELTLAVDSVGPIVFGTPAAESVGRLVASLGEPDEDTGPVVSTGAFGTCSGEVERIVRWGPFVAIVVIDDDGTETFSGYRLDLNYGDTDADTLSSPTVDLQTLSGLKAGFSVLQLEQIYSSFDLQYEVVDEIGPTFQLYSSNTGNLLLWGPVTSDESTGIVLGIYAPDSCGRF